MRKNARRRLTARTHAQAAALLAPLMAIAATALTGCSRGPELKAVNPARVRVESTITTTSAGTVEARNQAALAFGATGRVSRVWVRPGDRVKKGQLLAQLESTELQSIEREARAELSRSEELHAGGLVSQVALNEARKAADVARANLDRAIIRAPFDGFVAEVNLEPGEPAQQAAGSVTAPIRVLDTQERLVKGTIDELDLAKVKEGTQARIRIPASRSAQFQAVVSRVVPFVSTTKEQDRTSQLEFRLTDVPADLLIPVGASADIELLLEAKENALAVPSRTILGLGDSRYVYRWVAGKAVKTQVKTGLGNYERTEILSGVAPEDTVLFPPEDFELKDGVRVRAALQPWP